MSTGAAGRRDEILRAAVRELLGRLNGLDGVDSASWLDWLYPWEVGVMAVRLDQFAAVPAAAQAQAVASAATALRVAMPVSCRQLTEAEALIVASLPVGVPVGEREIAAATGYSARYLRDLLAGLWRDGIVFKGPGSWVRAA